MTEGSLLQAMAKRTTNEEQPAKRKSPFHLLGGNVNPACIRPPSGGWRVDWTAGTAQQAHASTPTICVLCKNQFPELRICYGGFCRYKFVCRGCSIPTERLACYKCRHACKREPGCGHLATMTTRVTCIKCWEVNVYYEDCWEKEQVMWFWQQADRATQGETDREHRAEEQREGAIERERERERERDSKRAWE